MLTGTPPSGGALISPTKPTIVYQATNLVNGKRYVGITARALSGRMAVHRADAKKGSQTHFARALRLFGFDLFRFRIIKICLTRDEALAEERRLIALWRPGYNMTSGGDGGSLGTTHSAESRRRMSEAHRGWKNPYRGIPRDPSVIQKMVATRRARGNYVWHGVKPTGSAIEKMRATKRATGADQRLGRITAKPVRCLNDGLTFPSARAAALHYGLWSNCVSRVCCGTMKGTGGLLFEHIKP